MPRISVGQAALNDRPHVLYRFYDRSDVLLYVGITVDFVQRMAKHAAEKNWWPQVDRAATRIEYHDSRRAALDAEREAIKTEKPLYNDQHNEWVEVDSEASTAAAPDAFAREMLSLMLGSHAEVEDALDAAEADNDSATPGEMWAALKVAEQVQRTMAEYRHITQVLLSWIPGDVVWPAYQRAGRELRIDPGSDDLLLAGVALAYIDDTMSERLLDSLDAEEADGWRGAARELLASQNQRGMNAIPERAITLYAAAYARAARSGNPHAFSHLRCSVTEADGERCSQLAMRQVVFNDCSKCDGWRRGDCKGHGVWCSHHLEEFMHGGGFKALASAVA